MENRKIRTFGRIKGKNINQKKLDQLNIDLSVYQIKDNEINDFIKNKTIFFEIGFGYGEHTIHQAILNEDTKIIACETYINGILSLIRKIKENNLKNIKIYTEDARILLEKFPNNSIDKIFLLFPDPWPKKKQNKRRIINEEFVNLIKNKLKKNGILFFSSDILDYVNWTIEYMKNNLYFNFDNLEDCLNEPEWWIKTRYQEKAIKEGRKSYFLEFINK